MGNTNSLLEKESKFLSQGISKDIAYFYVKYIPPDKTTNNYAVSRLAALPNEKEFIDISQGIYLSKLNPKDKLGRYDILEADRKSVV